jgi:Rha family phage regulatory protein
MNTLVLTNSTGKDITTSLIIADVFEKEHKNVLADIKNLSCSEQFRELNFQLSYYTSSQGKELPMYEITKDGF